MAFFARFDRDSADRERWRAQSGKDPRAGVAKHRARMRLYDDAEELSTAERGTHQEAFIEPEGQ